MMRDPRLMPARPDLAAEHLRGEIDAARYVAGRPMHVCVGLADLRRKPSPQSALDTQALHGEDVMLYEEQDGWAWVQLVNDDYVGYLARDALAEGSIGATHRICVNRTFVYPAADIKALPLAALPREARVKVEDKEGAFARLAGGGFLCLRHLKLLNEKTLDFVAIAEELLGSPYFWGGRSSLGIDCSGLVQVALAEAGVGVPRDTDLQERALGAPLPVSERMYEWRRGDLVFWKGHVGIMRDGQSLLHANAHHMLVVAEPLATARDRIRQSGGGAITAVGRL